MTARLSPSPLGLSGFPNRLSDSLEESTLPPPPPSLLSRPTITAPSAARPPSPPPARPAMPAPPPTQGPPRPGGGRPPRPACHRRRPRGAACALALLALLAGGAAADPRPLQLPPQQVKAFVQRAGTKFVVSSAADLASCSEFNFVGGALVVGRGGEWVPQHSLSFPSQPHGRQTF